MKKIIALLLVLATMSFLASCAAGIKLEKLDPIKIADISVVVAPDAEIDKDAFAEAYNKAEVEDRAEADDKSGDVIVVSFAGGKNVLTLYYLEDEEFAVTGTAVEKDFIIEAPELARLYKEAVDPSAKFVKIDAESVGSVTFTKNSKSPENASAFIEAYNKAKLVGKVADEKGENDVIMFVYDDHKTVFTVSYIGKDQFIVSGSLVDLNYVIESEELAKLYNEAVK